MRLTIFGSGYVGLVTGACMAEMGNHVVCVDIDEDKIARLNDGEIPIYEPGLEAYIERNVEAGPPRVHHRRQESRGPRPVPVHRRRHAAGRGRLGRPAARAGRRPRDRRAHERLPHHRRQVDGAGRHRRQGQGRDRWRSSTKRGKALEFDVVSNPEFLKEGAAIDDFMKPDRIVIGTDNPRTTELLKTLYEPFNRNHDRMISMDIRSAELTKYAANAMLATKISFMNELANLAERFGADIEQVRIGIGSDPRIGYHFIYPGAGYGGSCFPKDVQALAQSAADAGYDAALLKAVEAVNTAPEAPAVREDRRALRRRPHGQDDRALGPVLQAQHRRHARGAEPRADGGAVGGRRHGARLRPRGDGGDRGGSIPTSRASSSASRRHEALEGADALAIMTEWQEFRSPDFDDDARRRSPSPVDLRRPQPLRPGTAADHWVSPTTRSAAATRGVDDGPALRPAEDPTDASLGACQDEPCSEILPVILSGGSGTRLWPVSRVDVPEAAAAARRRQGHDAAGHGAAHCSGMPELGRSLPGRLQRGASLPGRRAAARHRAWTARIVLEPEGRNTAPAVALAALHGGQDDPDAVLLVMPADHVIADVAAFQAAVARAARGRDGEASSSPSASCRRGRRPATAMSRRRSTGDAPCRSSRSSKSRIFATAEAYVDGRRALLEQRHVPVPARDLSRDARAARTRNSRGLRRKACRSGRRTG